MANKRLLCKQGFTLIEMIGVLAIMAILAAVIAPNVIKQMQRAMQDTEEKSLELLMDGLENYVLENRIIPLSGEGAGTWSTNIASQMDLPVKDVYKNDMECDRRYWFDPSTNLNGLVNNTSAYNQNTVAVADLSGYTTGATASPPTNPRAMIISDLSSGCSNNIKVAGVAAHTAGDFDEVWEQADPANDPLVESDTLKIGRINFSQLFESVTLQAGNGSIFSRRTYSSPLEATPTDNFPIITVEKNSHIFSYSYSTGGFSPTVDPGGTASLDIGTSPGGIEIAEAIDVIGGVNSVPLATVQTSPNDIDVGLRLTIAGAGVINGNSGYIDTTIEYGGEPQYKLEGQAGDPTTISLPGGYTGASEVVSFNVIYNTEIFLYDQSWDAGTPAGDLLFSATIKDSENFLYTPGPPTMWGR